MALPKNMNPRSLMERAIEVMKNSVEESRVDGKVVPRVGALLVKVDGSIDTAARGELRNGDHAEFALLERKNRSTSLDGAVLFTTLEPCAPGARQHPKLSCAERIVLARIEEVWVGTGDPDPKVDGKGINYLQANGVQVHIFDRDLQEKILKANREFIDQATERAEAARSEAEGKPATGSSLERSWEGAAIKDLDPDLLEKYRKEIGASVANEEVFHHRLVQHGLLREKNGSLVPTGSGILLFGKAPRDFMPQAALLGTLRFADGREETRDFEGPALLAPDRAIQWLKDKLPNPIDRSEVERREVHAAFWELVREGLVNSLVHRDYSLEGAKCQLKADPDKVVLMSPGPPVEPITMEQLRSFSAPMLSRNPVLHFVFSKMKLAEERGLGLDSMKSRARGAGLPLPSFSFQDPYVVLTLSRSAEAAVPDDRQDALDKLSEAERRGWEWLTSQDLVTTAEYEQAMNLPNRTAKNHLKKLTDLGLLEMTGAGRATKYRVQRR
jgi:ATP-dependent DNA helicase RecG